MKVLCPGIGLAIRSHLAVHGMTRAALAAKTGLSVPQIGRVTAGNGVIPEATFTALRRALATPWTVNHCPLSERPCGPNRRPTPAGTERDYTTKRRYCPALDDFNGVVGGWL